MIASEHDLASLPELSIASTDLRPSLCPPELCIDSQFEGDIAHVVITGELDTATDRALRIAIAGAAPRVVDLDLGGVTFMGCSSLTVLLQAQAQQNAFGQCLSISAASSAVRRLLDFTGLSQRLVK
ncbi:MAG: STAS domain-containing protein [Acidimicrobiales bacterium]